MRKQGRKGGRIEPDFSGPYVIRSICGKVVTLSNSDGATLKNKYSVNHIKPYRRSQNDDRQVPTQESHKIPKENETRKFSDGSNSLTMGRDLESITKDISLPQRPSVIHFAPKKDTQVCDATTEFAEDYLQRGNISTVQTSPRDVNKARFEVACALLQCKVLQLLKTKTLAEDKEDSELTRSVKAKILDYMEGKYEDSATQSLLDTSFLDPRFKADYISAENLIEIKAKLMAEMKTTQMEREPVFDATAEVQTGSPQSHGAPTLKSHFYRHHNAMSSVAQDIDLASLKCTVSLCERQCDGVKELVAHLKEHIVQGRAVKGWCDAQEKDFKEFGHAKVFSKLVADLNVLEETGITIADETVVKGTLYCIAGDNLGSHCIGSSEYFCRYCLISQTQFQGCDPTSCGPERTTENYRSAVDQLETEQVPDIQGIKFRFSGSNSNLSVSLSSFYLFESTR
ncbi:hypothetical protein SRHO_G00270770 [Serrasalmus rhombeus]